MKKNLSLILIIIINLSLGLYLKSSISLSSDLLAIFQSIDKDYSKAVKKYEKGLSSRISFTVTGEDLNTIKLFSKELAQRLNESGYTKKLRVQATKKQWDEVGAFYFKKRKLLLSKNQIKKIENAQFDLFYNNAIKKVYSPVSEASTLIDKDPLLLFTSFYESKKNSTKLKFENRYLVLENNNGLFFSGYLSSKKEGLLKTLNNLKEDAKAKKLKLDYSSVALYGLYAKNQAMKESSLMSTISILIVIVLFIFFFKRITPVILSTLIILTSCLMGLCLCTLVFGQIHFLSLLFSMSIVGIIADYCIHYFIKESDQSYKSGAEIFACIQKPMFYGMITSLVGFSAFVFTPIGILREFALFSFMALGSSYLMVKYFLTLFYRPSKREVTPFLINEVFIRKYSKIILIALVVVCSSLAIKIINTNIEDDLRNLGEKNNFLRDMEENLKKAVGIEGIYQLIFIKAQSNEELLIKDEFASNILNIQNYSYRSLSQWIPSLSKQGQSQNSYKKLLPVSKKLYKSLGLNPEKLDDLFLSPDQMFSYEDFKEKFKNNEIHDLYLGKLDTNYYSAISIFTPIKADLVESLDSKDYFIYDKIKLIKRDMHYFRGLLSWTFLAFLLMVFLFIAIRFNIRSSFIILSVPVFSSIFSIGMSSVIAPTLNIFHILGSVLVFCLSIDYSFFYYFNRKSSDLVSRSVTLSSLTTICSFGMLAFSQTQSVCSFGLCVVFGIVSAWMISPLSYFLQKDTK